MDLVKMVIGIMIVSSIMVGCSSSSTYPNNIILQNKYYLNDSNITYEAGDGMLITWVNDTTVQFNATATGGSSSLMWDYNTTDINNISGNLSLNYTTLNELYLNINVNLNSYQNYSFTAGDGITINNKNDSHKWINSSEDGSSSETVSVITYPDVLAEKANSFVDMFVVSTGATTLIGIQPDYSRPLYAECTADPMNSMEIIFEINGTDTNGNAVNEGWAISATAGGNREFVSNNSLLFIDTIEVISVSTGFHVCSIGHTDIFGLPNFPFGSTSDVIKVIDNSNAYTRYSVNPTYGTVNVTGQVSDLDEFTFYIKPS